MMNTMDSPAKPNKNCQRGLDADATTRLTKPGIARRSLSEVRQMKSEELIELILVADVPLLRDYVADHAWYSGRHNLEQVSFLAWRTVQNQGY